MSKANGTDPVVVDPDVVVVGDPKQLPFVYIPYSTVAHARAKHPVGTIYHFKSEIKQGWQIVAWPIILSKPVKDEDVQAAEDIIFQIQTAREIDANG